ncbi:AAA family ATPase [Pantoea stewartii]|uniref:AAA family ATPase n=1 Tax=Pantoea stewartii TaxID=66269 RepID=UPI0023F8E844|nr:AAA family ATPase [Pantoea stewartii]MDF7788457.1 AAA family ATPase [Pantoea stewartii]
MLSKIEIDDFTIQMTSDITKNLYNVDSLSLLIGKNGSGKTKALCEIINNFCSRRNSFYNESCRFYGKDGVEVKPSKLSGMGMVYFTSLPFRPKFSHRNLNFIDASLKINGYRANFDIFTHKENLASFNIYPVIVAKKNLNKLAICRSLINIILKDRQFKNKISSPSYFQEFIDLRNKLNHVKVEISDSKKIASRYELNEEVLYMQKKDKYITERASFYFFQEMLSINDEMAIFSSFTVIEKMIKQKLSGSRILDVLCKSLNVPEYIIDKEAMSQNESFLNEIKSLKESTFQLLNGKNFDNEKNQFHDDNSIFTIEIEIDPYNEKFFLDQKDLRSFFSLEYKNISSGEMALLSQIVLLSESITELKERRHCSSLVVLIDEGDAFLHLQWQRSYIFTLNRILGKLKENLNLNSLQIIIASHSPLLATDVPSEFICRLDRTDKTKTLIQDKTDQTKTLGFAAPLYALLSDSFGTNTIGEFSATKVNKLIEKIKAGKLQDEDKVLISYIDNPLIKREIERLIKINIMGVAL